MMNHLWQSTWFAAIVWLATLALRRNGARLRYSLWTAASLKFLMPFSWLVSLGAQFEWRAAPAIARPAAAFVMEEVFAPSMLIAAPETVTQQTPILPWLLAGVWVLGSAAVLFWWWRQWRPLRAVLRTATPVALADEYNVEGLPVLASSSAFEPGVIGIRRPVLLLPTGLLERLTPAQMNALVAHERCHVRCRDNLVAATHMAVEAIFWFHPLVWWIGMAGPRARARVRRGGAPRRQPAGRLRRGILTVCRWSLARP
jgi:beta-lactamase regulating signal transducer with metallopeptidase domain